ncbi:MAG TPA: hypothetical protein DDZ41_10155 [Flavobacterium sp.]|nr:hypothetical protein [Flavobacterium sp.]
MNYDEARRLLIERFDKRNFIIEEHIRSIFNIKPIDEPTSQNLLSLLDEFNSHLRSLKNLGRPTDYWDDLIIYLIISKLDFNSKTKWRDAAPNTALPTFNDISKFIINRSHSLEVQSADISFAPKWNKNIDHSQKFKQSNPSRHNSRSIFNNTFHVNRFTCIHCKKDGHTIMRCHQFLALPVNDRIQTVKTLKSCENCLNPSHSLANCPNQTLCRYCQQKHHSLLHVSNNNALSFQTQPIQSNMQSNSVSQTSSSAAHISEAASFSVTSPNYIMLATAEVLVACENNKFITARAMLDSGSQVNFITESLASRLGIHAKSSPIKIRGIGCSSLASTGSSTITIKSKLNNFSRSCKVQILNKISNNQPCFNINISEWVIPSNLSLAVKKGSFINLKPLNCLLALTYFLSFYLMVK